eukprot:CAMPEP_0175827754 /NCGR_PEP_ID=MMETSP0107_2-20121207/12448_1 /TAXON_ID=195067 ORGANISM="Goniomonas pacifica, Strain CCMP1869" /NCGR_SAMPLE_ID=MMETSP0107_2 /ASSEMBLY_ACC=CAM_ASM_000203 /LENGTH=81 /DNA_ID=CAMNT_0017140443 /DNA_START=195 /DNA_END=437 /DNA_ORIENTATION=-
MNRERAFDFEPPGERGDEPEERGEPAAATASTTLFRGFIPLARRSLSCWSSTFRRSFSRRASSRSALSRLQFGHCDMARSN